MARPDKPDMLPKRTKKVGLGIYRTQIRPKTRGYFFSYSDQSGVVQSLYRTTRIYTFLVVNTLL